MIRVHEAIFLTISTSYLMQCNTAQQGPIVSLGTGGQEHRGSPWGSRARLGSQACPATPDPLPDTCLHHSWLASETGQARRQQGQPQLWESGISMGMGTG